MFKVLYQVAPVGSGGAEFEDITADIGNQAVQLARDTADNGCRLNRLRLKLPCGGYQLKPGRIYGLDHAVVKIAGDPLAILQQRLVSFYQFDAVSYFDIKEGKSLDDEESHRQADHSPV